MKKPIVSLMCVLTAVMLLCGAIAGCAAPVKVAESTQEPQEPQEEPTITEPVETPEKTADAKYTEGTYTAKAAGNNGDVFVAVTFSADAITDVAVTENSETVGIGDTAIERIPKQIVEGQTLAVDTISGATNTSNAIIEAVKSCVEQAGGSVDELLVKTDAQNSKTAEELSADVVVVGSGLSGTCAALSAIQNGATVIMVEKLSNTGGSARNSEGLFLTCASDDTLDEALSIWEGRTALSLQDSLYPDYERLERTLAKSMETIEWFNSVGASFGAGAYQESEYLPLMQADVVGAVEDKGCAKLLTLMMGKAEELGLTVYKDTPATELVIENGKLTGVKAESPDKSYTISCSSVILACGGFGANDELVKEMLPTVAADGYLYFGVVGNTGDGISMARSMGAATFEDNWMIPCPIGPNGALIADNYMFMKFMEGVGLEDPEMAKDRLMVNGKGQRFMNEAMDYPVVNIAMVAQEKAPYYALYDAPEAEIAAILESGIGSGEVFKGETIQELAQAASIPVDVFAETVERYSQQAEAGKDEDFGKDMAHMSAVSAEGPYYLLRFYPCFTGTIGGVKTDEATQLVLNEAGESISGLYAVGEMANRMYYNQGYFTGSALIFASISGRTAGTHAAQNAINAK